MQLACAVAAHTFKSGRTEPRTSNVSSCDDDNRSNASLSYWDRQVNGPIYRTGAYSNSDVSLAFDVDSRLGKRCHWSYAPEYAKFTSWYQRNPIYAALFYVCEPADAQSLPQWIDSKISSSKESIPRQGTCRFIDGILPIDDASDSAIRSTLLRYFLFDLGSLNNS